MTPRPGFAILEGANQTKGAKGMSDSCIPPTIIFAGDAVIGRFGVKFGYLIWINGQPWAYPSDATTWGKEPGLADALKLDPQRIVEETNSVTGRSIYAYLPEAPAF